MKINWTHEKFLQKIFERNEHYRAGEFKIIGNYIDSHTQILCRDKFGDTLITPMVLMRGGKPNIKSAVNPTEYWINMVKEVHSHRYNYSKAKYKNTYTQIEIVCEKHNSFWQLPPDHLNNKAGCPTCGIEYQIENQSGWDWTDWENQAKRSNNFDSFKLYIIKCWNDTETFYKIGKTFRVIEKRFGCEDKMPYNYEVIEIITGTAEEIFNLENKLKRNHKTYKYLPQIEFNGQHECFSKIMWEKIKEKFGELTEVI